MWQAPNQRIRQGSGPKKRDGRKSRRFHVKRVNAEIKALGPPQAPATVTQARLVLNDLSPRGLGLFASAPMLVGQEISLTIEEPKRFSVRGRIIWCQEYDAGTHILTDYPYHFRVGIEFLFETQEEENQVRDFCEEIERDYLCDTKAA